MENWNDKVANSIESLGDEFEKELDGFQKYEDVIGQQQTQPQNAGLFGDPEMNRQRMGLMDEPLTTIPKVENNLGDLEPKVHTTVPSNEVQERRILIDENGNKHNNTFQQTSPINAKPQTPAEFLKNMKFDLTSIQMVDASPIEEVNNFEFVLNNKSKTQIIANQSNYIAYMESLNYNEISALTNSTLDDYAAQLLLAQTVHSKINTTSIGALNFQQWSQITSHYDLDSFLYGIYLQTFPGDTKFNITCGKCKDKVEAVVNNDTLITGKNEETFINLQELLNGREHSKELLDKALVNTTERLLLPDSKIIMDIKLPTIKKHLDLVGSVNKNVKQKTSHILSLMIFLNKVLMINVKKSMETGSPCYYEVTEREKIARIISQLSFNDAKTLTEAIEKMIAKYAVEYKIKSFKCPKCHEELGDIPVDMETLLFYQILQL